MLTIGYALTGSFCTFSKSLKELKVLVDKGYNIVPIMSKNSYTMDTRFGKAEEIKKEIKEITGKEIIHTIEEAEPIGPKSLLDALVVAPATGNTIAKVANGVNDTCVTMAIKSHLRNSKPVIIAVSTNDALSGSAINIGKLMNTKNIYFVPMSQDNYLKKPTSLVADFSLIEQTVLYAMNKEQIQPLFIK